MIDDQHTLADLAAAAYVYGFPLVYDLDQVARYVTTGIGANPAAPFNRFSHGRTLASPADRFVTINNDTIYSFAQLDLSAGPLRLDVPDTGGRYYVMQFIDAWTNNFAYVGKRATGTDARSFLLVPPGWEGAPGDSTVIRFPTHVATIAGRWAVDGADDLAAAHALQDATRLTPLEGGGASLDPAGIADGTIRQTGDEALDFFERYRRWSQAFAPAERDRPLQASFAPLGLTGDTPVFDAADDVRAALTAGYHRGAQQLVTVLRGGHTPERNGWQLTLHVFDYNLDFFEIGTLDSAEWKIADAQERLIIRAGAALGGLWGNHAYEAAYFAVYADADGAELTGANRYELRLDPLPPTDAFWSLTMYDVPDYYLVENAIGRYSVGDRTPGIVFDDDGALTITMSHTPPDDPKAAANWLPAPPGPFRPILRAYNPRRAILDGSAALPPIRRVDGGAERGRGAEFS